MKIRRWTGRCLVSALAVTVSGQPPATAQLLGSEFQISSYTTDHQRNPAVAADGAGNFIAVWSSFQDGSDSAVVGQRFNSAGGEVGTEFQVNSYTTNYQSYPALASDEAGNFLVVWESYGQDGSGFGIFGQRYDSAGVPAGSEFQINTYTTTGQRVPAVAVDGSGNFVVVWAGRDQDGSGYGVFGQRFNAAGTALGGEFQANTYTTSAQTTAVVAADALGNFVAVWMSSAQDGSGRGVFGQKFDSAGVPSGSEFQVNSYTTHNQQWPALTANGLGDFVVVWESYGQDGWNYGVFGQRLGPDGLPVGSEFQVNSVWDNGQGSPAVAADARGDFVVVWQSYLQDGSSLGLIGRSFDPGGNGGEGEFQINTYSTGGQLDGAVTVDSAGNFIVAWESTAQDGSGDGVFAQRVLNWIFLDGFESWQVCDWSVALGSGDVCF